MVFSVRWGFNSVIHLSLSLQFEHTGSFSFRSDSLQKNQDLEFDRNRERFQFLKVWNLTKPSVSSSDEDWFFFFFKSLNMLSVLPSGALKPSGICESFLLVQGSFTRSTWSTWLEWCLTKMATFTPIASWERTPTPLWSMDWEFWAGVRQCFIYVCCPP